MCITTIGKIIKIDDKKALVQLKKSTREVRIDFVDAKKGDFIYVSGNLAIERIDKKDAEKILNERAEVDKK
jgi:hydrogenase maturation factor